MPEFTALPPYLFNGAVLPRRLPPQQSRYCEGQARLRSCLPPLYVLPTVAILVLRMVLLERPELEFFGRLVPWASRDRTGNWDYPSDQTKVSSG